MGTKAGLALFLASLGDTLQGIGKNVGERSIEKQRAEEDFRRRLEFQKQSATISRPQDEEDYKRKLMISMGIDPDTREPIPGFYEAKQKLRSISRRGGGGDRGSSSSSGDLF